jgi:hypothetical protein
METQHSGRHHHRHRYCRIAHNRGHYRWLYVEHWGEEERYCHDSDSDVDERLSERKYGVALLTGYPPPVPSKAERLASYCASSLRAGGILGESLRLKNDMAGGQACVALFARLGGHSVPSTHEAECMRP